MKTASVLCSLFFYAFFSALLVIELVYPVQIGAAVVVSPWEDPLDISQTQPPPTPLTQPAPGPTSPPAYSSPKLDSPQSAQPGPGPTLPQSLTMPAPPTNNPSTPFVDLPRSPTAFGTYGAQADLPSRGDFATDGASSAYGRYDVPQASQSSMISQSAGTPMATTSKPFSNYRESSPISPYMGLYAREGVLGVDNYNAYVVPTIKQKNTNRTAASDIRKLQGRSYIQSREIYKLDRRTTRQRPARYMNYGNYYPGLSR